jgi:hypothetical protein
MSENGDKRNHTPFPKKTFVVFTFFTSIFQGKEIIQVHTFFYWSVPFVILVQTFEYFAPASSPSLIL